MLITWSGAQACLHVPEHTQPVQRWHLDDKRKQVIYDRVEELVCHLTPWQVCNALELVVEVQLRMSSMQQQQQHHSRRGRLHRRVEGGVRCKRCCRGQA
jgi:hypothetical protein